MAVHSRYDILTSITLLQITTRRSYLFVYFDLCDDMHKKKIEQRYARSELLTIDTCLSLGVQCFLAIKTSYL